jgi:hypothetical protein
MMAAGSRPGSDTLTDHHLFNDVVSRISRATTFGRHHQPRPTRRRRRLILLCQLAAAGRTCRRRLSW